MALELTGSSLTIEDTVKVARDHADISISTTAFTACEKAHVLVKKLIEEDNVIYGVSVGVGELDCVDISREDQKNHQENLILAHACGVGPYMKADQSRAMMLIRLNNFLRAKSGVSPQLLKSMVAFLNKDLAAS
ncbi:MAG TPA: aromatic amino acid lyase, partial [Candidatus Melainabacteria bacterium]|nr:aromatic amino acid lyase [Candidatus Melainabacteria bacterium]